MRSFAALLERLAFTPARLGKLALLGAYFAATPDPERGYALAALVGALPLSAARPAMLRRLAATRIDPVLFELSYVFVGDLAETVALIWPDPPTTAPDPGPSTALPGLTAVVTILQATPKAALPGLIAAWLDGARPTERYALLKLVTGALRVGVSARLAQTALAGFATVPVSPDAIAEIWHALAPPYTSLFAWLTGAGPPPDTGQAPLFRPPMLAHPITAAERATLDPASLLAEWKWDGVRVQLVAGAGGRRIYSRTGEDISAAFPDILDGMDFDAVLDGELLVEQEGVVAPFSAVQQRLNRRTPSARLLGQYPAAIRLYDILFAAGSDLRPLPYTQRRDRLEAFFAAHRPARMALSPLIAFSGLTELETLLAGARAAGREGLMLKAAASPYLPGRPRGHWWKWKPEPRVIDAVLMYAEPGHGRRGGTYSDYAFGLWTETGELVTVGRAYSGYTDAELRFLDRFVRAHTIARFGPVREVAKTLVLEIGFDAVAESRRHKSGLALRFPRILRLRTDKPAAEADRLETLRAMITG